VNKKITGENVTVREWERFLIGKKSKRRRHLLCKSRTMQETTIFFKSKTMLVNVFLQLKPACIVALASRRPSTVLLLETLCCACVHEGFIHSSSWNLEPCTSTSTSTTDKTTTNRSTSRIDKGNSYILLARNYKNLRFYR
jgi:hypothetical protein